MKPSQGYRVQVFTVMQRYKKNIQEEELEYYEISLCILP